MRDLETFEWFLSSRSPEFMLGITPQNLATGVE